ncbi:hypothetical protein DVH05_023347 [Phytophthora capsici]|nr:hypothetical protein DVH05_023347 [Phytophthora capsici]
MRRSARLLSSASCSIKSEVTDFNSRGISSSSLSASSAAIPSLKFQVKAEKSDTDGWTSLCSTRELSCALTLESGQVFAWRRHPKLFATWLGVVGRRVFAVRERDDTVQFQCLHPTDLSTKEAIDELSYYFRLDVSADPLYERWTTPVDRMTEIICRLRGMRIIRQDPVECLFSFICSSNNNIARIQGMVDKLKATYGDLLYTDSEEQESFYEFPSVDTLAVKCQEATLRSLGFGYRAAFIVKTAKQLQELGGASYLLGIRDGKRSVLPKTKKHKKNTDQEDEETAYQEELMVFSGVGRKVADCVALFSLDKTEAIPVDTHVWQIACRELNPTLSDRKSITPTVYHAVGDLFRTRFSPHAGWAHSILFAGDLSAFKPKKTKAKQKTNKHKTEAA